MFGLNAPANKIVRNLPLFSMHKIKSIQPDFHDLATLVRDCLFLHVKIKFHF